jgi:hypothetical protein
MKEGDDFGRALEFQRRWTDPKSEERASFSVLTAMVP